MKPASLRLPGNRDSGSSPEWCVKGEDRATVLARVETTGGGSADLRTTAYERVRVTRLAGGRPDPLYETCRQPRSERAGDHAHPSSNPHNHLLTHGYGPVARTLLRHGLLDELILWVHPMLAGVGTTGDMIFTEDLNARLSLLDVQRLGSGVVLLSYGPS